MARFRYKAVAPTGEVVEGEMEALALAAMEDAGRRPATVRPAGSTPLGEAGNIHEGGGRYISLLGRNGLFHHPHDRWPAAVDVDAVVQFADAFVRIAKRLSDAGR